MKSKQEVFRAFETLDAKLIVLGDVKRIQGLTQLLAIVETSLQLADKVQCELITEIQARIESSYELLADEEFTNVNN